MNPDQQLTETLADLNRRREAAQKRFHGRQPKGLKQVMGELITKRGYGKPQTEGRLADAWAAAVGPNFAPRSRAGKLSRGRLEVTVTSSVMMQELDYQKKRLIERLAELIPEAGVKDLRFRVGRMS